MKVVENSPNLAVAPQVVKTFGRLLVLALVASLLLGIWGVFSLVQSWWTYSEPPNEVFRWPWLITAIPIAIALRLWRKRSPKAPAWGVIATMAFLATCIDSLSTHDLGAFYFSLQSSDDTSSIWEDLLHLTGADFPRIVSFAVSVPIVLASFRALVFNETVRDWFRCIVLSAMGFPTAANAGGANRRRRVFGASALSFVVFSCFSCLPILLNPVLPYSLYDWAPFGLSTIDGSGDPVFTSWLPYTAAIGVLIWNLTERLQIDDAGIRMFLFEPRYTIYFALWKKIRRIEIIRHGSDLATAVLHYHSRFRIPIAFGVHFKRYANPKEITQQLLGAIMENGVKTQGIRSPRWMALAGWLVIFTGLSLIVAQHHYSNSLMSRCLADPFPVNGFPEIAGLFPLTSIYLASVFVTSVGLGMLSGYHRGSPRFLLLILWIMAIALIPDPLVHWLVYMALYAILSARIGTVLHVPYVAVPAVQQWDLAFTCLSLAPYVGALGYFVGAPIARRKLKPGVEFASNEFMPTSAPSRSAAASSQPNPI